MVLMTSIVTVPGLIGAALTLSVTVAPSFESVTVLAISLPATCSDNAASSTVLGSSGSEKTSTIGSYSQTLSAVSAGVSLIRVGATPVAGAPAIPASPAVMPLVGPSPASPPVALPPVAPPVPVLPPLPAPEEPPAETGAALSPPPPLHAAASANAANEPNQPKPRSFMVTSCFRKGKRNEAASLGVPPARCNRRFLARNPPRPPRPSPPRYARAP